MVLRFQLKYLDRGDTVIKYGQVNIIEANKLAKKLRVGAHAWNLLGISFQNKQMDI